MVRNAAIAVALLVVYACAAAVQAQKQDAKAEVKYGHGKYEGPHYPPYDRKHLNYQLAVRNISQAIHPQEPVVGGNVVARGLLYRGDELISEAVMTGVITTRTASVFAVNMLLDIQDMERPTPNSLIASGVLKVNTTNYQLFPENDDLVVGGGSGYFAGVQGRIVITIVPPAFLGDSFKSSMDFQLTLPAHRYY